MVEPTGDDKHQYPACKENIYFRQKPNMQKYHQKNKLYLYNFNPFFHFYSHFPGKNITQIKFIIVCNNTAAMSAFLFIKTYTYPNPAIVASNTKRQFGIGNPPFVLLKWLNPKIIAEINNPR